MIIATMNIMVKVIGEDTKKNVGKSDTSNHRQFIYIFINWGRLLIESRPLQITSVDFGNRFEAAEEPMPVCEQCPGGQARPKVS